MGTWGTALYSDDFAADLRGELKDVLSTGLPGDAALSRLESQYASSLGDPDERPVFWLAVAHTAWKLGRPIERATAEALRVISSGADLLRWTDESSRRKRAAVLERVHAELRALPPTPRRLSKPTVAANAWTVGEVIAYRLMSGAWVLFRVIGHTADKGGRHSVCEPLDWSGATLPCPDDIAALPVRKAQSPRQAAQFMLGEPRRRKDAERLLRTGLVSLPVQRPARYVVFVFPHVDRLLQDVFGLQ